MSGVSRRRVRVVVSGFTSGRGRKIVLFGEFENPVHRFCGWIGSKVIFDGDCNGARAVALPWRAVDPFELNAHPREGGRHPAVLRWEESLNRGELICSMVMMPVIAPTH